MCCSSFIDTTRTQVIKEIAQSRPLDATTHAFKVVVMHDVDHLSKEAQHTMERYMATCSSATPLAQ